MNDWIDHNGGPRPVPPDTCIRLHFYGDAQPKTHVTRASAWIWDIPSNVPGSIKAYQIVDCVMPDMGFAPVSIWAWTWNLGGWGKTHGRREWVHFQPKPILVSRWVRSGRWFWQGRDVEIEQDVAEYVRADRVVKALAQRDKARKALEACLAYFETWDIPLSAHEMAEICKEGMDG